MSRHQLPEDMKAKIERSRDTRRKQIIRRCLVSGGVITVVLIAVLYKWNVIPHNYYYNSKFGITTYKSSVDYDGDGIDDQTDILEGVRAYIATKPKYKSAYYVGGYPDDEYGVCTDVVAQGFLNAGYDLREMVSADIEEAPEEYNIATPDKNIDFRRVRNLRVFFERHAISLTTDVNKIEEWQGGDIIIFEDDHIGIVSDKRNGNGIAFIIHHGSPMQAGYEQDILEGRDDIAGHYRWN